MGKFLFTRVASRRSAAGIFVLLAWLVTAGSLVAAEEDLTGRLLVATPELTDPNFTQTVIYLVKHDRGGALGLVVNRPMGEVPLERFLEEQKSGGERPAGPEVLVHYGGPVERTQAFILHSPEVLPESSVKIADAVAFSRDRAPLYALHHGQGPRHLMLALGYSGWAPGQLEAEIKRGSWYITGWDDTLVFGADNAAKWQRAVALSGPEL